jgi:PAT family beta-lactamase induction signal transducer AmpG
MAMGMMFPGMWSGWLQDHIGYKHFFLVVILATIPSFLVASATPDRRGFREERGVAATGRARRSRDSAHGAESP